MSGPVRQSEQMTNGQREIRMRRLALRTALLCGVTAMMAALCGMSVGSGQALAAYGDGFGIAAVNDGAGPAPETPVFDGSRAFWAGACQRAAAPADLPALLEPLGGIGTMPATVPAHSGRGPGLPQYVQVPAPATPDHCVDWGTLPEVQDQTHWSIPPAWRLPAATAAGSHADGSVTMWVAKGLNGSADGSLDNIYVDLPPGVVGDPNAIPKCTAEQFAVRPLLCPPETQVGILRLQLVSPGATTGGSTHNGPGTTEEIVPVFNLQPRRGNVAELGVGYLATNQSQQGRGFVTARIVAKARTNGDFGVTSFVGQLPAGLPVISQAITLWGIPWDPANDVWRAPLGLQDGGESAPLTRPQHPCRSQPGALAPAPPNVAGTQVDALPWSGLTGEGCPQGYRPEWGEIKPFINLETDCNQTPVTRLSMDSFQHPGGFTAEGDPAIDAYPAVPDPDSNWPSSDWKTYGAGAPPVTGCETLDFEPDIEFAPTTSSADGASGLKVDLELPQKTTPPFPRPSLEATETKIAQYVENAVAYWKSDAGRATAHLKDTVVTLPPGVSVNPSGAAGLAGCSDAQIGLRQLGDPPLFNNGDPFDGVGPVECPQASIIGTARVVTPLLDEHLTGEVVLGQPKSTVPTSGQMFRMFLVVRSKERGLIAKIYGSAKADPATGQITATFRNNPEVPFERLSLELKGGPRGLLAMPPQCGGPRWSAGFTPWSSVGASTPVADSHDGGEFAIGANCGFGFAPQTAAGMDTSAARANGTFAFRLTRGEGQQWLRGLTATLPPGLLASVRGVPLCTDSQAAAGSCPAASRVGIVDAAAGSGTPLVLEQKGEVFLTEGYKGGEYGLMVKIRPIAGPFRGPWELSPIIVRQAIHVDRTTARVTAISDPFPTIHHGVPLRVRSITVLMNRSRFMLNPSGCGARQTDSVVRSAAGAAVGSTSPFRASGCAKLPFKPKLTMRLAGRRQMTTGRHPGIRAQVTQAGIGEAGIRRAEVRLPGSLALDVENAQALCEYEDGTKPDLDQRCPRGSIVGRARAVSPLLNEPLAGNVYFVKNVRRDPRTGNLIRTLPMIVAALRGEIAINLRGESSVDARQRLVSTFEAVPDAPVSRFNLNVNGGRNGIIAVTRTRRATINLCAARRQIAESDMDGHNGRRHDTDVVMRKPCTKRQVRRAKRQKARDARRKAAARRAAAVRRR